MKLYMGDCLEVMAGMEAQSVDAIIGDLPYGTTACKWDSVIPFAPMWEAVKRVLKPRGAFVTTASQPFTSALIMSNIKDFRYEWIWEKNSASGGMNANKMPLRKHENIAIFYKKLPIYNPIFSEGKPYRMKRNKPKTSSVYGKTGVSDGFLSINNGVRYPTTTLKFGTEVGLHPTQKPVALYEYLIKTYTNEGDIVLDMTMGSGTTGVACMNTGRNFIGIEKDPSYFGIAERRIKQAQEARQLELV